MNNKKVTKAITSSLFLVLLQLFYMKIFGRNNMIIGILLGLASISFLARDFTKELYFRTFSFLILSIYLVAASFLANFNIYLGLVINFFTVFTVTYVYMNDFRHPTSYIFLMIYIMMLSSHIELSQLPLRIFAIVTGILIIILFQIIFNKNSFKNKSSFLIKSIGNQLIDSIDSLLNGNYNEENYTNINNSIRSLILCIHEKSHIKFKNSSSELKIYYIAICLSKLNILINKTHSYELIKYDISPYLLDLKNQISSLINSANIDKLAYQINDFLNKSKDYNLELKFINECNCVLKLFLKHINTCVYFDSLNYISLDYIYSFKNNLNLKSLKFRHSIRLAISISMLVFFSDLLNFKYQTWVVLSAYVILQPYYEDSIKKAKERFCGVISGSIIFFIIFSVIKDFAPLPFISFLGFIGYFYFSDYSKKVIMTTIISLSSISLVENLDKLSLDRFLFVSLGIFIGLLFNKYILPYNIEDSIIELKNKYDENIKKTTQLLYNNLDYNLDKLIQLSIERNKLEHKLILNSKKLNHNIYSLLHDQNLKIHNLHFSTKFKWFKS